MLGWLFFQSGYCPDRTRDNGSVDDRIELPIDGRIGLGEPIAAQMILQIRDRPDQLPLSRDSVWLGWGVHFFYQSSFSGRSFLRPFLRP